MTFQASVKRQYTTGFPGDVIKDGPMRALPGRIVSPSIGTDPAFSTNRVSRAFGYAEDSPATGTSPSDQTLAAMSQDVTVGGARFFGILFHPKHYELLGTVQGGSLAPSLDLPQYALGEFCHMGIIVAELFNETTAVKTAEFGDGVAFVLNSILPADNPQALPFGALVSVPPGGTVPNGANLIPNARVLNTFSIAASAAGAPVSSYTIIELTQ